MFRYFFLFILLLHGLIHLMGFAKSFGYGNITQLSKEITKPIGLIWLTTSLLFIFAGIFFQQKKESWIILGIIAVVLSQLLIFSVWQEAKFGTIANLIILVVAILSFGMINFENAFRHDVKQNLKITADLKPGLLLEEDLQHLPEPVQHYLRYAGVIGKPKIKNVRIVLEGEMRDKGKEWFPFTTEQYNFFEEPSRLFFMKGKMFGLTVPGYHRYHQAKALMDIRLFGYFSFIHQSGEVMDKAETVTLFNDMCLMAPATLVDKRIAWEAIDHLSAKASFTNQNITISAILYFNDQGQLINFVSEDRIAVSDMKQYLFSTPVSTYKNMDGINIMTYGEAIWHYPEGEFVYGKFRLKEIAYNVAGLHP